MSSKCRFRSGASGRFAVAVAAADGGGSGVVVAAAAEDVVDVGLVLDGHPGQRVQVDETVGGQAIASNSHFNLNVFALTLAVHPGPKTRLTATRLLPVTVAAGSRSGFDISRGPGMNRSLLTVGSYPMDPVIHHDAKSDAEPSGQPLPDRSKQLRPSRSSNSPAEREDQERAENSVADGPVRSAVADGESGEAVHNHSSDGVDDGGRSGQTRLVQRSASDL